MARLRIISGIFKSRILSFPSEIKGLRPTCSRVRETLFNWLSPDITSTICLDAFAGSGSLGFEAISRGAKHSVLIEKNRVAIKALQDNRKNLNIIKKVDIMKINALEYLSHCNSYDIIFLDPPFKTKLLVDALNSIDKNIDINHDTLIYIEAIKSFNLDTIIPKFRVLRCSIYGNTLFALVIKVLN